MNKNVYALALACIGLALPAAAQKQFPDLTLATAESNLPGRSCATMDVLQAQLAADPAQAQRMAAIEAQTRSFVANPNAQRGTTGTVTIPVVVHVLYNTTAQNVSKTMIDAQIKVLNDDFAKLNADANKVPAVFSGLAANTNIQFALATTDPDGKATDGVERVSTRTKSWSSNDAVKNAKRGGADAWPASQYLNLWVCNLGQGLLGYAQFPGGAASTDGVVILYSALPGGTARPYDKGRTATHEVGHWLNLRHIWGDATCGNDQVSDTPTQQTANYGCPSFPHVSCSNSGDMSMNYMDYTDDACMYMFTTGQSTRMNALFGTGGARASLLTSPGLRAGVATASSSATLALYPNPATDVVNLKTASSTAPALTVLVYDAHGLPVRNVSYDAATGKLNVQALPKGLYRLTVSDGRKVTQQSFIKE